MPQEVIARDGYFEPLASPKAIQRQGKFKKIHAATSAYSDRDYHTGKESIFRLGRSDKYNREGQEREGRGVDPLVRHLGGPAFKTPQWDRTVHND